MLWNRLRSHICITTTENHRSKERRMIDTGGTAARNFVMKETVLPYRFRAGQNTQSLKGENDEKNRNDQETERESCPV